MLLTPLSISDDGPVTVIAKHFEAGQGAYTGLATLVAEELDADWNRIRVASAPADERLYNNLLFGPIQVTGGSTSIANSYEQYRQAGAMAREKFVLAAAELWKARAEEIGVEQGRHPCAKQPAGNIRRTCEKGGLDESSGRSAAQRPEDVYAYRQAGPACRYGLQGGWVRPVRPGCAFSGHVDRHGRSAAPVWGRVKSLMRRRRCPILE